MKRMKVPDYKDKNVFGVPLIVTVQRYGQPLPLGLQQALRYLRSQCLDQVSNSIHTLRLQMSRIHQTVGFSQCLFTVFISLHNG